MQRMLRWTKFAEKITTRSVYQNWHCNAARIVNKSLEAPKRALILFVSLADKNPPHAGKAYKIRDTIIEYVTTEICSPDIPWCCRSLSRYIRRYRVRILLAPAVEFGAEPRLPKGFPLFWALRVASPVNGGSQKRKNFLSHSILSQLLRKCKCNVKSKLI